MSLRKKSVVALCAALSLLAVPPAAISGGFLPMSAQTVEFKWEWPAGRPVGTRILVKVGKVAKASKGFFGIGASPSLADALPDATDVTATVLAGPAALVGKSVLLRLPGMEAAKLKAGELAGFGLIEDGGLCICVAAAPSQDAAAAGNWLAGWTCQ
ncbi:hypothetical protein CJ010_16875 [Azoarcus sp. DD4]|nr:hypothetical protein CJ010_16875 [Azoarcus sp. DD4]